MNGGYSAEFDHEYGSINGLPRHSEETSSSPNQCLLYLTLAKRLQFLTFVAKIDTECQFSAFPQGSALFWLEKTNW
jgi:hypothetical protein